MLVPVIMFAGGLAIAFFTGRYLNYARYQYLRNHYVSLIMSLAAAIDSKDAYSLGHTERVSRLTMKVADELRKKGKYNINKRFKESLQLAALLHDVGKVGIPDNILRKPGPLDDKEWKVIKKHPQLGANILEPIEVESELKQAVHHHQEHFDGTGYPAGLSADEIPLMSRIIMVVDAYDAMTSDRPYRPKRSPNEAAKEIKKFAGKQFDPDVVNAFLNALKKMEK